MKLPRSAPSLTERNPLRSFFNARTEGRGIWKWEHYFDIYHRHLERFRGREVHVMEIGVYSGGSLEMWCDYFGPDARIYGVDVEPACRAYDGGQTKIFIGDQADKNFWRQFRNDVPVLDVVIDDGGHLPEQQITSLQELLPHLRGGGVYICEDVHGAGNEFFAHAQKLADQLNAFESVKLDPEDNSRRISCATTPFQSTVSGFHLYPFVVVIEKSEVPVGEFVAPKHGTAWQPFLK
jgi:hypothetical protein